MRILKTLTIAVLLLTPFWSYAQSVSDSLTLINANWNWTKLGKGAKAGHAIIPMFGDKQSISVIKYPAKRFKTYIIDAQHPNEGTTPAIAKRHKAKAAINASYFDMKKLIPATYFVSGGRIVGDTYKNEFFRCDGYVATKEEGSHEIEIASVDTSKNNIYPSQYQSLLVSGPLVLIDKNIPPFPSKSNFYANRHPRTVIGFDDKGYIYFVVIDGRCPDYGAYGANISEVAHISRYLGMTNAINLDGGGSSTAWTKKSGVINYPCDNRKFDHDGCRTVPNIIIMK